jgi:hypothetical protein
MVYQGAQQLGNAVLALGARVAPAMPFTPELNFELQFLITLFLVVYTCAGAIGKLVLSVTSVVATVAKALAVSALDYLAACAPVRFLASCVFVKVSIASEIDSSIN